MRAPALAPAEAVTWRNVVRCDVGAGTLTKVVRDGWNGGASSTRGLAEGDGYAEFTVPASAGYAMMGLGYEDYWEFQPDEIPYAFYTYPPTSQLMVFEWGTLVEEVGAYTTGDKLRIAIEEGYVNYYRNGALVHGGSGPVYYDLSDPPYDSLRVKAALYSTGAAVENAVLAGTVVDEVTPSAVRWQNVVSSSVGSGTLTKTGDDGWTGGASSDMSLGAAGGATVGDGYAEFTVPEGAGIAMMGLGHGQASLDFTDVTYAFYTYPPTGQLMVFENGGFVVQLGAYATGDKLRIAVEGPVVTYYWNGALVHTVHDAIFPLYAKTALYSVGAVVQDAVLAGTLGGGYGYVPWQNEIGVAIYGNLVIKTASTGWNNGGVSTHMGIFGSPAVSANHGAGFVVTNNPGFAMFGLSNGDTDQDYPDIDYAFYTYPPTGQLMVFEKGDFVGQFGAYSPGDQLSIEVWGGEVHYYWNYVLVYTSAVRPTFPLRIDTALYSAGAGVESWGLWGDVRELDSTTQELVTWQNTVGVGYSTYLLFKTAPPGWNNSGASSTRGLAAGQGEATFYVTQTPGFAMFGLSNGDTDQDYPDIDYAFYTFPSTGQLMVYENGAFRAQVGAYAPYDYLSIVVEEGGGQQRVDLVVNYYRNGALVYRSAAPPTFPLRVDTALFSSGAQAYGATLSGTLVDIAPAP